MSWKPSKWEFIKFGLAYCILTVPFAYCREYVWFGLLSTVFFLFVACELFIATRITNKETLSGRFWNLRKRHPKTAMVCLLGIVLFWIYIILHLLIGI